VFAEPRAVGRVGPARLAFRQVAGRTVVATAFASSPLRLLTPKNHGTAAWAYTSTLGGGLVGGDEVRLRVDVGPGAAALLASQGQNRVYRSTRGCRSELVADVRDGGLFALLPDPTVCFAEASYDQTVDLRLAPAAAAVAVDVLAAGRAGERWAFRHYSGDLRVRLGERLLVSERVLLDPRQGALPERMGRFEAVCAVLVVGERLRAERAAIAARLDGAPLRVRADCVEQANPLGGDALLVRIAAASLEEALHRIRGHLRFLPALLGDDPWARRP
jgi:urease accessory protein